MDSIGIILMWFGIGIVILLLTLVVYAWLKSR